MGKLVLALLTHWLARFSLSWQPLLRTAKMGCGGRSAARSSFIFVSVRSFGRPCQIQQSVKVIFLSSELADGRAGRIGPAVKSSLFFDRGKNHSAVSEKNLHRMRETPLSNGWLINPSFQVITASASIFSFLSSDRSVVLKGISFTSIEGDSRKSLTSLLVQPTIFLAKETCPSGHKSRAHSNSWLTGRSALPLRPSRPNIPPPLRPLLSMLSRRKAE